MKDVMRELIFGTLLSSKLLLMEEIPNNHLANIKPCKITGKNLHISYQLVNAGFLPTVSLPLLPKNYPGSI